MSNSPLGIVRQKDGSEEYHQHGEHDHEDSQQNFLPQAGFFFAHG